MAKERGLTLLEMLVALVLLSAVITLSGIAYRFYVVGFFRQQEKLQLKVEQLRVETAVKQQVLSAAEFYFTDSETNKNRLLFVGLQDEMTFVSHKSIQKPNEEATAWLGVQDGHLTYCEASMSQLLITDAVPSADSLCEYYRLSLFAVTEFSASYFGWRSFAERYAGISEGSQIPSPFSPEWFDRYNATELDMLPLWIRFSYRRDEQEQTLWLELVDSDPDKKRIFMTREEG